MQNHTLTIGIIGAGNWGKNHIRVFHGLQGAKVKWVIDTNQDTRRQLQRQYPNIRISETVTNLLGDSEISGVVIASPSHTHYHLAKAALLQRKDVLVEKPLAQSSREAAELIQIAEDRNLILMVGHLLLYHPAIRRLKALIDDGVLGDLYYLYAQRLNLGVIRTDENCLWSLAPHDLSVMLYLLGDEPVEVNAQGQNYVQNQRVDVVFLTLKFADGKMAHIHTSWLDPHKIRKVTLVGSKKMVVFDDIEANEKVKIYDKGTNGVEYTNYGEAIGLRFGDVLIPRIPIQEPLKLEAEQFISSIMTRRPPVTDGQSGLAVVKIMEKADQYMQENQHVPSLIPHI